MNNTTIRIASENAGDTGIILVDGKDIYWDGFGVMNADDATCAGIDPDTEIIDLGNEEYRTA